jgi:glycosyltransferase involved in cell wall biosynthesis
MSVEPKVSVVLMTYNHEPYFAQAIDSALAQETPFPVEIIVSEDCSSDRTQEIVSAYAKAWPKRIRTAFSPANLNSNVVLERAFAMARGRYLALLDGDDYWTRTDKLAQQAALLDTDPGAAVCFHDAILVNAKGHTIGRTCLWAGWPERLGMAEIITGNHIPACSAMVRRDAIRNLPHWYSGAEYGDWPLWVIAARSGALVGLRENMAAHRIHRGGYWSGQTEARQTRGALQLLKVMDSIIDPEWKGIARAARLAYRVRLHTLRGRTELAKESARALHHVFRTQGIEERTREWLLSMIEWRALRP